MADSGVHFSQRAKNKQGPNGDKTGLTPRQPADLLEDFASAWREGDRLDVQLLRALCRLSAEFPDQAPTGFTSQEIVEAVIKIRGGRKWSEPTDMAQTSADVRRQWNRLSGTWATKQEGIVQRLRDEGVCMVPRLAKTEGGGAGRPSRYRIEWEEVANGSFPVAEGVSPAKDMLRYVCEDIEEPGLVARLFANGYKVAGWRRLLLLSSVGIPVLLTFLVFALFVLATTAKVSVAVLFKLALALGMTYAAVWSSVGPLLRLPTNRIVIAPWWMQSVSDDRLLEYRYPPRHPERQIKAVRYTARCPRCGGTMSAQSGGLEFWGRIIGRCEHAPNEHVYSFDHVTRRGNALRRTESVAN